MTHYSKHLSYLTVKAFIVLASLLFVCFYMVQCTSPELRRDRRIGANRLENVPAARVVYNDRVYGEYNRRDYEGPSCEEQEDERDDEDNRDNRRNRDEDSCVNLCREMYGKEHEECEELPVSLINQLYDFFDKMRNIQRPQSLFRTADIFTFGVMIDVHVQSMLELVKGWSEREARLFLIWVAERIQIAVAIQHHDDKDLILEKVFEQAVSRSKRSSSNRTVAGINEDLKGFAETFWSIAQAERNEAAFIIAHRLVDRLCSDRQCKIEIYCARVHYRRDRLSNVGRCPYQTQGRLPGIRGSDDCYIHGAEVWSFWEVLNRDGRIKDNQFDRNFKLNQNTCIETCGTDTDSKCDRE